MLADPDIQNVIQNFGGPLEQLPAENGVEKNAVSWADCECWDFVGWR
jgi:hypothetical protein